MKVLDELIKKLPQYANDYCRRIVNSIERKTTSYLMDAMNYLSDIKDPPFVYVTNESSKEEIIYDINVCGSQVAFLEFGTGISTQPYSTGLSVNQYFPSIAHTIPPRGTYGKGKGNQRHWGFYPKYMGNVSSYNTDFLITEKKYKKKNGEVKTYPLKQPVIITQGLPPLRMIYRAIQETKREVRDKKL